MTPAAKDTAAKMLCEVVKLPIGERAGVLAMVIRVLAAPDVTDAVTVEAEAEEVTEEMR